MTLEYAPHPRVKIEPLQWYVDKLKAGKSFSLARYGDGELYCLWGRKGQNCDGSDYTEELQEDLFHSLSHADDDSFIYGLQHVLPEDRERILWQTPDTQWYDSEVFGDALVAGELYPLIEQLRKMPVVIIGNWTVRGISPMLHYNYFIEIPERNAHRVKDEVLEHVRRYARRYNRTVFLFSAGMAANVFISELHCSVPGWLLDVGHIWDVFVGNPPRSNTENMTLEQINRNLRPLEVQ